jgi:hypothetical protein
MKIRPFTSAAFPIPPLKFDEKPASGASSRRNGNGACRLKDDNPV